MPGTASRSAGQDPFRREFELTDPLDEERGSAVILARPVLSRRGSSATWWHVGSAGAGLGGIGALSSVAPVAGTAATALVATGVWAIVRPVSFVLLIGFLSAAIPKAGWVVGGFPVPVLLVGLVAAALCLRVMVGVPRPKWQSVAPGLIALALSWLVFRLVALLADGASLTTLLAVVGWYGLPLGLFLVGPGLGTVRGKVGAFWARALDFGVLTACAFGLLQQFFGLDRTAVPGITLALGADYSAKPLQFEGGTKIPSTYQNGNVLGVTTGIFFLMSVDRILRGRAQRRDHVMASATAVATILSGSRTVLVGLVLGSSVLVLKSKLTSRTLRALGLATIVSAVVLLLVPVLAERYSVGGQADVTAGRTEGWSEIIRTTSLLQLSVGDSRWADPDQVRGEGVIGALQQVGVVGVALLVATWWSATRSAELRRWRLLLIPLFVSFAIDSAYLVFPTLFLPIARMFAPVDADPEPVAVTASERGP